jgi:hypothetical protein
LFFDLNFNFFGVGQSERRFLKEDDLFLVSNSSPRLHKLLPQKKSLPFELTQEELQSPAEMFSIGAEKGITEGIFEISPEKKKLF